MSSELSNESTLMIFAIHRTIDWWRCVGENLGFGRAVVVTDLKGEGDLSVVSEFYEALELFIGQEDAQSNLLSRAEAQGVIGRCRTLRWLDQRLALAMVYAMTEVVDRLLAQVSPAVIISYPIDRYVMDVLERRAAARGIPYLELTASAFSGMSMFLRRGALVERGITVGESVLEQKRAELVSPSFVPSYVPRQGDFSAFKFLRTFYYFRARSLAFKGIAWLKRDLLNLYYLDAQSYLGHKPRLKDISILRLVDRHWERAVTRADRAERVFFGLQLFPEASIDYWIPNADLIDHEECVFEAARAFSEAGFLVLIKDHPLQFGFRQVELIKRMLSLQNTVFVPYDVGGQKMLQTAGVNFTFTGTLGLQAALAGLRSVATDCYYTTPGDFVIFRSRRELPGLPDRVRTSEFEGSLDIRQRRIVGRLLRGSFDGDLFSFRSYRKGGGRAETLALARSMGATLRELSESGRL